MSQLIKNIRDKPIFKREMYHTQEKRGVNLTSPVKCTKDNAWLGDGYYFWDDLEDAHRWGRNFKKATGYFEIYCATIHSDNILDTVFREEHYRFWVVQVEKAAKHILRKTGLKPTIKDLNDYFKERVPWNDVEGVLFQDLPTSDSYTVVSGFYYKKRIQLVVYNLRIIESFRFHTENNI